ncbi:MAG TPA: type I-U CRISPR-associated protein Cas8c [Verrucomicrobiae bacterium]|nr:type I-U CRISPR-associated protein Cas8c [Verrucomicrobiae bacterium]
MSESTHTIRIRVDATNPGQFFACCGLLELASRLNPGSTAWFVANEFCISTQLTLREILGCAKNITLAGSAGVSESEGENEDEDESEGEDDKAAPPLLIVAPVAMRLDWWFDKPLKTWAGSMDARAIFLAMCKAIDAEGVDPLNQAQVVFEEQGLTATGKKRKPKKREPFYFDARRTGNAHSIDIGFSPDKLKAQTLAHPAVEALCFIGLQRARPRPTERPRVFDYQLWSEPTEVSLVPAAVNGLIPDGRPRVFRFENWFRTGQRKHKAFRTAKPATTLQP